MYRFGLVYNVLCLSLKKTKKFTEMIFSKFYRLFEIFCEKKHIYTCFCHSLYFTYYLFYNSVLFFNFTILRKRRTKKYNIKYKILKVFCIPEKIQTKIVCCKFSDVKLYFIKIAFLIHLYVASFVHGCLYIFVCAMRD